MSTKKVPVSLTLVAGRKTTAPGAATSPTNGAQVPETSVSGAGTSQISMQELDRLKALSRELMGLIIAAQHRS